LHAYTVSAVYFLPVWFQAIKGVSAVESGIHLLPMMISVVIMSIATGILTSKVGYYTPFLILGVCLGAIGAGLLTTLGIKTSTSKWIGFQILYGFGFGFAGQAPNMAAQTVLPREDVPIGISLMFFGQQLFGATFICVGQNVLDNQLANRLAGFPGITRAMIPVTGATDLLKLIPAKYHIAALEAYNSSLRVCFQVGLIMACLAILGGFTMEWRTVKKNLPSKASGGAQAAEEGKRNVNQGEKAVSEASAEPRDAQVSQGEGKKSEAAD
jgi:MFS family permease